MYSKSLSSTSRKQAKTPTWTSKWKINPRPWQNNKKFSFLFFFILFSISFMASECNFPLLHAYKGSKAKTLMDVCVRVCYWNNRTTLNTEGKGGHEPPTGQGQLLSPCTNNVDICTRHVVSGKLMVLGLLPFQVLRASVKRNFIATYISKHTKSIRGYTYIHIHLQTSRRNPFFYHSECTDKNFSSV